MWVEGCAFSEVVNSQVNLTVFKQKNPNIKKRIRICEAIYLASP